MSNVDFDGFRFCESSEMLKNLSDEHQLYTSQVVVTQCRRRLLLHC